MCSPAVIHHVIANLGPADRGTGVTPVDHVDLHPQTCFSEVFDLTHPLDEDFPSANGEQWLTLKDFLNFEADGINFKRWSIYEHIGTHIDAPIHFSADGASVDRIPVDTLIVPLAVIDIRARAAGNADTELTPNDIAAWEAQYGPLPQGCCVAMNAGWDSRATGPGYRNADSDGVMHFPGFHVETADMLIEEHDVIGMGVDTLSIDNGPSDSFPVHRHWLPSGRWAIEGLANLATVPASGATIVVGAPTIVGATGGPSRIFALS